MVTLLKKIYDGVYANFYDSRFQTSLLNKRSSSLSQLGLLRIRYYHYVDLHANDEKPYACMRRMTLRKII